MSVEELQQENARKVVTATSVSSAVIAKMESMATTEEAHEEYDSTFLKGKKKRAYLQEKNPYTELEIKQFLNALVENNVFDLTLLKSTTSIRQKARHLSLMASSNT